MIRALEARNFRMLAGNRVELGALHVLVGPNATGKSTFLDALQFIADLLANGAPGAVEARTPNFYDLCFAPGEPIGLAVEVTVPNRAGVTDGVADASLRYEVEVGIGGPNDRLRVLRENLYLVPASHAPREEHQPSLFAAALPAMGEGRRQGWRKVVSKTTEGRDYFQDERSRWNNVFRFGPEKAALGSLPEDPGRFPLSIAVRDLLRDDVRTLALDAREMRRPAGPGGTTKMTLDGSNLPYVVRALKNRDPILFQQWVEHLATGVAGLTGVGVRERPEDKHLVLEAKFAGRHDSPVPSWMLSDGTLRLMALTLLTFAALPESHDVFLIEEPENGLHPLAIQTAFEALGDAPPNLQILCATHSPIFLAHVRLEDALVFRRASDGSAIVRRGPEIPELEGWPGRARVSELFATGILA